jgi:ribosomal protein S12 methylthiotransferase
MIFLTSDPVPPVSPPSPPNSTRGTTKGRYAFVSLGCPKNLVDSERMLGMLRLDGYELVDDPRGADFAVVNTCGFIEAARQESFAAIDEMLELKRRGDLRVIAPAARRAAGERRSKLPGIDHLVGVFGPGTG